MQRPDFLWSTEECAVGVATAIIKFDHIVKRGGLAIAEVRGSSGDLAERFRAPEPLRNALAAKVAIAFGVGIVAEMSIHVEVPIRNCGIADKGLVSSASNLSRVGMRRQAGANMQTEDREIIVRE